MSSDNENKVVQFPLHKVKKSQSGTASTLDQPLSPQRRTTLVVSLVATMFLSTFIMSKMNQAPDNHKMDRGLASTGPQVGPQRDLQEDILLAKKIAKQSLREPASRGREPSAEDILRHGELAGLYALSFSDTGALVGIDYSADPGAERFVRNREDFLTQSSDLLRVEFDQLSKVETVTDDKYKFEVYELRMSQQPKARVHFKLDAQDHLYSMKVESLK